MSESNKNTVEFLSSNYGITQHNKSHPIAINNKSVTQCYRDFETNLIMEITGEYSATLKNIPYLRQGNQRK
ncbi:hypothetical protein BpHYR1_019719 [Brachionus plicatilis]|uniref:Uncharacterized protein n=1 Tax=Brachionus plicatilis TaxID=10195 RepID=A0A3M7PYA3_BRAPC|nr:hypothetical protein BpHYR1_019719 [Brachionus plicatilis]